MRAKDRKPFNGRYYCIEYEEGFALDFRIDYRFDTRTAWDNECFRTGNYFETEQDAQDVVDAIVELFN